MRAFDCFLNRALIPQIIQDKPLDSDVTAVQAAQNRDALIKDLYSRLFAYIVRCANDVLGAGLQRQELFDEMQTSVSDVGRCIFFSCCSAVHSANSVHHHVKTLDQ